MLLSRVASLNPGWRQRRAPIGRTWRGSEEGPTNASVDHDRSLLVATSTATATAPVDVEGARLAVVEAVDTDTMNFGGIYLDAGNTLVIEYVGANAGRAAVDSILDPRISVRWQQVDRSRAELDEIAASIKDSHLDGVVMIGIDTIHNQVEVTVSPSDKVGRFRLGW